MRTSWIFTPRRNLKWDFCTSIKDHNIFGHDMFNSPAHNLSVFCVFLFEDSHITCTTGQQSMTHAYTGLISHTYSLCKAHAMTGVRFVPAQTHAKIWLPLFCCWEVSPLKGLTPFLGEWIGSQRNRLALAKQSDPLCSVALLKDPLLLLLLYHVCIISSWPWEDQQTPALFS